MPLQTVDTAITRDELRELARERFGDMVKAVVDVSRGIMAVGSDLHADAEALLLEQGSREEDLWGINFYPDNTGDGFVEFDSMINIRPSAGNRSRGVESPLARNKIMAVVARLVRN